MLKCILVQPHAQYRGLYRGLIERLSPRCERIHLIAADRQRADFWQRETNHLPNIEIIRLINRNELARAPVPPDIIARARRYEQHLDVTINHLTVRDRHLGRGYALGGTHHPRSQLSQNTSYAQLLNVYVAELDYWTELIDRLKPSVVINAGEIPWRVAAARSIPYRTLAGSRYKNLHYWAHDEYFQNPEIARTYAGLAAPSGPVALTRPYSSNAFYVAGFSQYVSTPRVFIDSMLDVARQAYWTARGYEKAKGYYLSDTIGFRWRRRAAYKEMSGEGTVKLASLSSQPFVFYPLHTEPEAALQGLSPTYTFQLETIARVARVLPAGVLLAVKETQPALGRRPRDFYRQIKDFKNTVFLDINDRGLDVAQAANAVVTITGTAGFEAALLGKPVVTFGVSNFYNLLPHVHFVTDVASLETAMRQALNPSVDQQANALAAARLLEAMQQCSFDLLDFNFMKPEHASDDMISAFTSALLQSVCNEYTAHTR